MIELRWLEYESSVNPETGEHFGMPSKYRKLQYRTCDRIDPVMPFLPSGSGPWTEWKDVPVESV